MTEILRGDKLFEAAACNNGAYTIVMRVYDDVMASKGAIGIRQLAPNKVELVNAFAVCLAEKECTSASVEWLYIHRVDKANDVCELLKQVTGDNSNVRVTGIAEKIMSLY